MLTRFKVYLSGPITGLTYDSARGWTQYAKNKLEPFGIDGYMPLRGKDFLRKISSQKILGAMGHSADPLSTPKAIVSRDYYDVASSDAILCNLVDATRVSIGTVAEIAWAWQLKKPIVLVMEKELNIHEHAFVREMCTHQTTNLDIAIDLVKLILLS